MTNTANTSLQEIKKAEADAAKMISQAEKAREEKITQVQAKMQDSYLESEEKARQSAKVELEQYKEEVAKEGQDLLNKSKQEVIQLKKSFEEKQSVATQQGLEIFQTFIDV